MNEGWNVRRDLFITYLLLLGGGKALKNPDRRAPGYPGTDLLRRVAAGNPDTRRLPGYPVEPVFQIAYFQARCRWVYSGTRVTRYNP